MDNSMPALSGLYHLFFKSWNRRQSVYSIVLKQLTYAISDNSWKSKSNTGWTKTWWASFWWDVTCRVRSSGGNTGTITSSCNLKQKIFSLYHFDGSLNYQHLHYWKHWGPHCKLCVSIKLTHLRAIHQFLTFALVQWPNAENTRPYICTFSKCLTYDVTFIKFYDPQIWFYMQLHLYECSPACSRAESYCGK